MMEYRRFGKTNKKLSVITLGTMRFKHGWNSPADELPEDSIEDCKTAVELAFENGINHIETADGYKKSEYLLGLVLNKILKIPRDSYHLMTKGVSNTAKEARILVEKQLRILDTDHFDFYAWHGLNNQHLFEIATKKGGPVDELLKMKEEGIIGHVGFSTHAPLDVQIKAIETDLFEFINLHYYYFFQRNFASIQLAQAKDMGVFIISPNDKGGQLFNAPEKLRNLTSPLTPIQWNARFCLQHPHVHTLSFGITEPLHFEEMKGIFPTSVPMEKKDKEIFYNLNNQRLLDPWSDFDAYKLEHDPSGLNIPEILRYLTMYKGYDMLDFGKYRYNMMKEGDHWLSGVFPTDENLNKIDMSKVPEGFPIKKLIKEAHHLFYVDKKPKTTFISAAKIKPQKINSDQLKLI